MNAYDAFNRFSELAGLIVTECPAVTEIVAHNEYIEFSGSSRAHEKFIVVFPGIEDDSLLDGIKAVRRLEREAEKLVGALPCRRDDFETAALTFKEGWAAFIIEGLYCYDLEFSVPSGGEASAENELITARLKHYLRERPSGHERLEMIKPRCLSAFFENPIHKNWISASTADYGMDDILELRGETPVSISVEGEEGRPGAYVKAEFPVPADILWHRDV